MQATGAGDGVWRGSLDAYGHMLLDHLAGIEVWQIVERHDGFIRPGVHPSHYFTDRDAWPPVEREAVEHVALAVDDLRGYVEDTGWGVAEVFDHGDEWGYVALLTQTS
jgi:hypothetical protein